MSKASAALVGIVLAAGGSIAWPAQAQAAPVASFSADFSAQAIPRDGMLHLSSFRWDTENPPKGPELCGDYVNSVKDLGACKNKASAALNSGFTGSYPDVKLHNYVNWAGAAYCLRNGEQIDYLGTKTFNEGAIADGRGQSLNNAIESIHWVSSC